MRLNVSELLDLEFHQAQKGRQEGRLSAASFGALRSLLKSLRSNEQYEQYTEQMSKTSISKHPRTMFRVSMHGAGAQTLACSAHDSNSLAGLKAYRCFKMFEDEWNMLNHNVNAITCARLLDVSDRHAMVWTLQMFRVDLAQPWCQGRYHQDPAERAQHASSEVKEVVRSWPIPKAAHKLNVRLFASSPLGKVFPECVAKGSRL